MAGSSATLSSPFFTDVHRAMAEAVDTYLERLGGRRDELLRTILDQRRYPDELMEAMAWLGVVGAMIPEEYGGSGAGLLAVAVAMERFSAYGLGNTLAMLTVMDGLAILRGGSESQRLKLLPAIAEGRLKLAFAITEPDAGTNSFNIGLRARRDGSAYRLTGEKAWITGVDRADMVLVVARTTGREEVARAGLPKAFGLSLFLVPTDAPGMSRTEMSTVGIEGFSQFHLHFDDAEVAEENLVGEPDQGAAVLFEALNPERIIGSSLSVGLTDYFLTRAVEYANQRRVFGERPIGAYQAVAHPLARIRANQEAARALMYSAAEAYDRHAPSSVVGTYANMAKLLSSENAFEAADRAIQTHGGNGFVADYMLIQMLAPARLAKTAPINNEMILNYIAEHDLGLPRSY